MTEDVHLHTHITFSDAVAGEVRLALLISENNIIAAQLDYQNDPEVIEDFEHNHMLRGSLSGADGLVVATDRPRAARSNSTTPSCGTTSGCWTTVTSSPF